MSLFKRTHFIYEVIFKQFSVSLLGAFSLKIATFVILPIFISRYGPDGYANYAQLSALVSGAALFLGLGSDTKFGSIIYLMEDPKACRSLLVRCVIAYSVLMVLFLSLGFIFVDKYSPGLKLIYVAGVLGGFSVIISNISVSYLRANYYGKLATLLRGYYPVLLLGSMTLMSFVFGETKNAFEFYILFSALLILGATIVNIIFLLLNSYDPRPPISPSSGGIKLFNLQGNVLIFGAAIFAWCFSALDRLILEFVVDKQAVATYFSYFQFASISLVIGQTFDAVFARLTAQGFDRSSLAVSESSKSMFILNLVSTISSLLVNFCIFILFYEYVFKSELNLTFVFMILVSNALLNIRRFFAMRELVHDSYGLLFLCALSGGLVGIIINIVISPLVGVFGAFSAYFVACAVYTLPIALWGKNAAQTN
jgi:O-antigen/teichoic acid export membrane protein